MAFKKTLMVNFVRVSRRRWSLALEGTDPDVLADIAAVIEASEKKHGVAVVNAASPFGEAKAAEKKKNRKPRSDKGAKRTEHPAGDGQHIEGRLGAPSVRA